MAASFINLAQAESSQAHPDEIDVAGVIQEVAKAQATGPNDHQYIIVVINYNIRRMYIWYRYFKTPR